MKKSALGTDDIEEILTGLGWALVEERLTYYVVAPLDSAIEIGPGKDFWFPHGAQETVGKRFLDEMLPLLEGALIHRTQEIKGETEK